MDEKIERALVKVEFRLVRMIYILELAAPDVIIRNEKRMLRSATMALLDAIVVSDSDQGP